MSPIDEYWTFALKVYALGLIVVLLISGLLALALVWITA